MAKPKTEWTRTCIAAIPVYHATINGNVMDVWQVMPGQWQANVNDRSKSGEVGCARTHHECKRQADAWAMAHPVGSYRWCRKLRFGAMAWAVESSVLVEG